jgi:hypothetical protein
MKPTIAFTTIAVVATMLIAACNTHKQESRSFQLQIDSLRQLINMQYKPGVGELMTNIQLHHAKLWFAGKNANWQLAAYNRSLIESAFKKLQRYHPGTEEARDAAMINGPMDSVSAAIGRRDSHAFQQSFVLLTTTCNNCHTVTNHAYNVILIPHTPPVDNQDFTGHPLTLHKQHYPG